MYKNHDRNIWNDCKHVNYFGLKSSDSALAFITTHGPTYIQHSTFIGESGNLGEPNEVRLKNGSKVMWHRSTPKAQCAGVIFNLDQKFRGGNCLF